MVDWKKIGVAPDAAPAAQPPDNHVFTRPHRRGSAALSEATFRDTTTSLTDRWLKKGDPSTGAAAGGFNVDNKGGSTLTNRWNKATGGFRKGWAEGRPVADDNPIPSAAAPSPAPNAEPKTLDQMNFTDGLEYLSKSQKSLQRSLADGLGSVSMLDEGLKAAASLLTDFTAPIDPIKPYLFGAPRRTF